MRILFLLQILIATILIPTLGFNAVAAYHHKHSMQQTANAHKCTYPHITLYVYTQPVQKRIIDA